MLRPILISLLAFPAVAAPGQDAAADMRCAALMSRVSDALEAAGHHSTLLTVRDMQAQFASLANSVGTAGPNLMVELARTPPVTLPASSDLLARIEACAARLPR